jgi:sarcosine oxidase
VEGDGLKFAVHEHDP